MRIENGGPALFRLVRFWSRRWATVPPAWASASATASASASASAAAEAPAEAAASAGPVPENNDAVRVGHVLLLEAIDAASRDGVAQIGAVAVELGLDRSNASRMLAAAVSAGLVTRTVSPQDARRTELAMTEAGREMLSAARAWQEETFARLTADWPAEDVRAFASYLVRLANQPLKEEPSQPAKEPNQPSKESRTNP